MNWRSSSSEAFFWVRLGIKVAVVASALYVAYHLYERNRIASLDLAPQPKKVELPDDAFVFVPKSYVTDLEAVNRKLIGKPIWVREGYRWLYEPGKRTFEPLERIVPTDAVVRDGQVHLLFEKDGKGASFVIGTPERVFVDDIFFVKDPREIYDHWTEAMWDKAAKGEIEIGMSEVQIGFTLGVGDVVRQSPGGVTRIVDYKECRIAGCQPVRVTYKRHVASAIEPIG